MPARRLTFKAPSHHSKSSKNSLGIGGSENVCAGMGIGIGPADETPAAKKCPTRVRRPRSKKKNASASRIHLKQESEISHDHVTFHVEQPNRVAVRLEFLMESAVIRLNDKEYMSTLYDKLVAEENLAKAKYLKRREKSERERVKGLVINGQMEPPEDLKYLYKHPVFRVNAMLRRLEEHNTSFYAQEKPAEEIVSVEPYEFEPNGKFFSHLHRTGSLWIPSEEKLAIEEKIHGKIERAKQRLLEKRHREAQEAKTLRTLFKSDDEKGKPHDFPSMTDLGSLSATVTISSDNLENMQKHEQRKKQNELLQKVREENRMATRDKHRREFLAKREQKRRAREEERIKEREKKFFDDLDKERNRIIEKHQERMYRFEHPPSHHRELPEFKASTLASLFKMPDTPPHLKEEESFKKIRKEYNLKGTSKFESYRPPINPLITKYLDTTNTADSLYKYGRAVKGLYDRKQMRADDFMIKLNRML